MNLRPQRRPGTHLGLPTIVYLAAVLLSSVGCSSADPELVALRKKFLLHDEPNSPTTIAHARTATAENPSVMFVARVHHDELEAFVPGQAAFLVTEILPDEHGHGGKQHADNCPFCQRKSAQAPRAAVQFIGKSGTPLSVDARELFGIKPGDEVVIGGEGEVLADLNIFQVTAAGIYLRSRRSE